MQHLRSDYYMDILQAMSSLYPVREDIRGLAIRLDIPEARLDLTGKGDNMWDSLLSYVDEKGLHEDLLKLALGDFPGHKYLSSANNAIRDKTAFITSLSYNDLIQQNRSGPAKKIFLIYSTSDIDWANALKSHLKLLSLNGKMKLFDMQADVIGSLDRQSFWLENIGGSDIILLSITANLFNDDNCMALTFSAHEMRKIMVPVLFSDCLWARIRILENIQPLPTNYKPVDKWAHKNEALLDITIGIEKIINQW
jgi:hypothetical protein